ncbi:hypothetical protein FA048_10775 [Pedobacter polaris]|uniref:histidine kinase n=1 Tax=Pedobacter polaris TaxID=2571273 RepID=A0A4V5NZZ8_9SPHI|nr:ATP-binding protein [Pedobacter polaris]TKC10652.1 hypothetical protein FA048_10775 [Pedobacter polaris]
MENYHEQLKVKAEAFHSKTKERSDSLMNYFVIGYFVVGIILANFYGTWLIAFVLGGISLLSFYSVKLLLPNYSLYQYVLSAILGIFMAQFIYQSHGMFEMYFFTFIGSAILVTYQKWTLQIPILIVVVLHHVFSSYLKVSGIDGIYFTSHANFETKSFIIHILSTTIIFFICGLWAYQMKKSNARYISQALQLIELQKEAQLSNERKIHADVLKKLNISLESNARELSRSNDELEKFAYIASHDLQEPLRMITAFLELLQERYEPVIDEKGKQYIHFASDGALRMKQLILDLLEYSKVGKTEDKLEDIDLTEMVNEITALSHRQINELQANVTFDGLPNINAFKAPIRQVFQNLISNALKYQRNGGAPIINITCKEVGDYWQFAVADNGIGINNCHFEQIFVIFKRLHARSEFGGTGIGLAVTKKIVEFMGGKIWVESELGIGSVFNFTLPKHKNQSIRSTIANKKRNEKINQTGYIQNFN